MATFTVTYDEAAKTLTVTWRGQTRVLTASLIGRHVYALNAFSVKFKTGTKLWPCAVCYYPPTGEYGITTGGYSNKGGATHIVGWYSEGDAHNSLTKGRII